MRKFTFLFSIYLLLTLFVSGCGITQDGTEDPSVTQGNQNASPTPVVHATPLPAGEPETTPLDHLILWVPAAFSPDSGPAGAYLRSHIDQFIQNNPGITVEVRVKSVQGPAGMLSSLEKTLPVAPYAAPALVLLPHSDFQIAAGLSLISPNPGLQDLLNDEDWYDYATKLPEVQNQLYGLPFAGDALILLYRPSALPVPPTSWTTVFSSESPLLFPAGSDQGLFPLNLYLSNSGQFYDEEHVITLDSRALQEVLTFFNSGAEIGVFPAWIQDYENDSTVWTALGEKETDLSISWISSYLSELPADIAATTIPSLNGESVTLTSGWLWAYSDPFPERSDLTLRLLDHLTDSEFMARWTYLAGYLPVRPSSMTAWENQVLNALLRQATVSAQNIPPHEVLNLVGPAMSDAVVNVISERYLPAEAARTAIDQISDN